MAVFVSRNESSDRLLVENHGGVLLNTTIEVAVNHETVRTLSATDLAPGASRAINFELTLEAGNHNLQVGGNNLVIAVFEESDPLKRLSGRLSRSAGSASPCRSRRTRYSLASRSRSRTRWRRETHSRTPRSNYPSTARFSGPSYFRRCRRDPRRLSPSR